MAERTGLEPATPNFHNFYLFIEKHVFNVISSFIIFIITCLFHNYLGGRLVGKWRQEMATPKPITISQYNSSKPMKQLDQSNTTFIIDPSGKKSWRYPFTPLKDEQLEKKEG
jgi:hypothetical protein